MMALMQVLSYHVVMQRGIVYCVTPWSCHGNILYSRVVRVSPKMLSDIKECGQINRVTGQCVLVS